MPNLGFKQKEPSIEVDIANPEDRKPSPFTWRAGSYIEFDHYQKKKTEKLVTLLEKHLLDHTAMTIMSYFNKYKYLNSYLVGLLHEKDVAREEEALVKNRIATLYKVGLLSRFRITYKDNNNVQHYSPFIYCLSEKGYGASSKKPSVPDIEDVLRRLAFNQYYINMSRAYRILLSHEYSFSSERSLPDGSLAISSDGKDLVFQVLVARGFDKPYERLFKIMREYASKQESAFIILVESELEALEIEALRYQIATIKDFTVLYLCDCFTFESAWPLRNLIMVNPENLGNYSTVSLTVDN